MWRSSPYHLTAASFQGSKKPGGGAANPVKELASFLTLHPRNLPSELYGPAGTRWVPAAQGAGACSGP